MQDTPRPDAAQTPSVDEKSIHRASIRDKALHLSEDKALTEPQTEEV